MCRILPTASSVLWSHSCGSINSAAPQIYFLLSINAIPNLSAFESKWGMLGLHFPRLLHHLLSSPYAIFHFILTNLTHYIIVYYFHTHSLPEAHTPASLLSCVGIAAVPVSPSSTFRTCSLFALRVQPLTFTFLFPIIRCQEDFGCHHGPRRRLRSCEADLALAHQEIWFVPHTALFPEKALSLHGDEGFSNPDGIFDFTAVRDPFLNRNWAISFSQRFLVTPYSYLILRCRQASDDGMAQVVDAPGRPDCGCEQTPF